MRRRRIPPIVTNCAAEGCRGICRRSQALCQSCFDRLPHDLRKGMAVARQEGRLVEVARIAGTARTWLRDHPGAGSVRRSDPPDFRQNPWWDR